MMKDSEVMKHTGFKEVQSDEKVASLLSKWSLSKTVWALVKKESEEVIGWFMLKRTILDAPELGFMLCKSEWGNGYATEVSKALLDYAFNTLDEKKVIASSDSDNPASIKVLKKIGFVETKSYSGEKDTCYFEVLK